MQTKRVAIREMNFAFETAKSKTNKKISHIKIHNPKRELFNRLKLLDSIGQTSSDSNIGSIRKGYIKCSKMNDTYQGEPDSYNNYLKNEFIQNKSFDFYSAKKAQRNRRKAHKDQTPMINVAIPHTIEVSFDKRRATKDYETTSTNLSTTDKNTFKPQQIKSLLELKASTNYTPSNQTSNNGYDSFKYTASESVINGMTPSMRSQYSIKNKKKMSFKAKPIVSKEIIAK